MKILIIRNYPNYISINQNTYNIQEIGLAKALNRRGHTCDIVFWTDEKEETVDYIFDGNKSIRIYYRRGKNILKNAVYSGIDQLAARYDVIQPCEYNQYQALLLSVRYPKKTVIYHGPYYSSFNRRYNFLCKVFDLFFLKNYIKNGTAFLAKSNLAKQFLISKGIKSANIKAIGVGLDPGVLETGEKEPLPQAVSDLINKKTDLKLLYIGRLEERRNIPFLFDIVKCLIHKLPDTKLILVGTGGKGYTDRCFRYADRLGITCSIYQIEKLEQKYLSHIYKNADFFLLPTRYEIFGMVLLEAMYFGTVVITTKNGGSDVLIRDGENGFILEDKSAAYWADFISRLRQDSLLIGRIRKNAHETIGGSYTWDALAGCFTDTYEAIKEKQNEDIIRE